MRQQQPLLGSRVEVVSTTDYRTHYVSDLVFGTALASRTGRCPAVCGAVVIIAAMVTAPGPLCALCRATP